MLQPLIQKFQRRVTSEIELKNRVLASNPTLFQLYKDLVVSAIVSPEEFWTAHSKELEEAQKTVSKDASSSVQSEAQQRVGIQAGFLTNIKPHSDEESGGIHYNLTPDTIEAIFRTYPTVKQKHAEYVPHSMSEGDFWVHFFESHYFHRDQLETGKNLFSGDQITMADSGTIASVLENDPFVNVSGFVDSEGTMAAMVNESVDKNDFLGGLDKLLGGKTTKQVPKQLLPAHKNRLIVQRMNYHSERVLSAQAEGDPGSVSKHLPRKDAAQRVLISDLVSGGEPAMVSTRDDAVPLEIANTEAYSFRSNDESTGQAVSSSNVQAVVDQFRIQLANYQATPYKAFHDGSSLDTFNAMTSENGADQPINFASLCGGNFSSALEAEYKGLYATLGELLRHFWLCFPVTPQLEQKLKRMHDTLASFETNKLKPFESRLSASGVNSVGTLTGHLHAMLEAANRKYAMWQARKSLQRPH